MTDAEGSERVLIVDDEEALAAGMARALRSRGIESDIALDGRQARTLFAAHDYALVLLDVRLPDESGYGLLQELRALRPSTAIVVISGVDDPELGRAALEHGAYGYFIKPVGSTQLYLLSFNNLRRRALERALKENVERLESMLAERAEQMARASELQEAMLPSSPFIGDGFQLAARLVPAREIGGDFYDWCWTTGGRLAISVGDVMGKGLPAALMMATTRAALRGASGIEPLDAGVAQAAGVMAAALHANEAFATVFHCVFDPASGGLEFVDAGHGHARIVRGTARQELLAPRSAPIGLLEDTSFTVGRALLEPGDSLVVFSDGLLDLRPDLATREVLLPHEVRQSATAQLALDSLLAGAAKNRVEDDVTALVLRRI